MWVCGYTPTKFPTEFQPPTPPPASPGFCATGLVVTFGLSVYVLEIESFAKLEEKSPLATPAGEPHHATPLPHPPLRSPSWRWTWGSLERRGSWEVCPGRSWVRPPRPGPAAW